MKKLIRLKKIIVIGLFCLIVFAGQNTLAQSNSQDEKKPTFDETMNWLQKTFADYATYTSCPEDKDYCLDYKSTIERIDQKNLTIKTAWKRTTGKVRVYIYEVPWVDLDKVRGGETSRLILWTINFKKSVKRTLDGEIGDPESSIMIGFTTVDIRDRVEKALNHAITLQGGGIKKKEIF